MRVRREDLLRASIAYVVEHGVATLSLRPMAAAIGTSARLLIFHFGSKERLVADVLREVHHHLRSVLSAPVIPASPVASPLLEYWRGVSARRHLPYWRLLYEVHFMALQNPYVFGDAPNHMPIDWTTWVEPQLPPRLQSPETARLVGAVFNGLMVELVTGANSLLTTRSLGVFIQSLQTVSVEDGESSAEPANPPRSFSRA